MIRNYFKNTASANTRNYVEDEALNSDIVTVLENNRGDGRSFEWLTVAWDYTYDSATCLNFSAEGSMDNGTTYTKITSTIMQAGDDAVEPLLPTKTVDSDDSGVYQIPWGMYTHVRLTVSAEGATASDLLSYQVCAHDGPGSMASSGSSGLSYETGAILNADLSAARTAVVCLTGFNTVVLFVKYIHEASISTLTFTFASSHPDSAADRYNVTSPVLIAGASYVDPTPTPVIVEVDGDYDFSIEVPILGENTLVTITPDATHADASIELRVGRANL